MRFSSAAIAAPLVLLTSSVFADTCTCPTNQGAVAQAASSFNDGASQPYVYTPPPVVQVPSVPATQKNLNNGAQKALDNMAAQGVIPASKSNRKRSENYHTDMHFPQAWLSQLQMPLRPRSPHRLLSSRSYMLQAALLSPLPSHRRPLS